MKSYFVYNDDSGYSEFETEAEAKAYADECLRYYEEDAQYVGEWPEETESIKWGKIIGGVVGHQIGEDNWRYELKEKE